jgi:hypothetical protein
MRCALIRTPQLIPMTFQNFLQLELEKFVILIHTNTSNRPTIQIHKLLALSGFIYKQLILKIQVTAI